MLAGFCDKIKAAYAKRWVVNCEPSMANSEHVIRYLGQYSTLNILDQKSLFLS